MWCQNGRTLLGCSHFKQDKIIQSWLWLDPRSHHRRLFWLNRNVKLGLCESSLILRLGPCPGCLCAQLKQRGSGALRQIFIHFNIHSFQDLKWWNEINASGVNDFIEIDLRIVRTRNSMSQWCCVGYISIDMKVNYRNRYFRQCQLYCSWWDNSTTNPSAAYFSTPRARDGRCRHFCPLSPTQGPGCKMCPAVDNVTISLCFPSHRKIANFRKAALCFKTRKCRSFYVNFANSEHWE